MTAANLTEFEGALRDALSPAAVSQNVASYVVDGQEPLLVAKPPSQEDVAAVLAVANANDTAVIPWGGGTQMSLGMPPARYDLALDLRALDRVVEYEPADLTVTVEASLTLAMLQALLAERGQWLPFDPPVDESATIGGLLATNASGPARIAYGSARDLLIGITVATAQGELIKAGGRVVKNVAGYDLGKLQIGALGTLGVIVQVSFKVAPLAASTAVASLSSSELPRLLAISAAVQNASLPANTMVLSRRYSGDRWRLDVRFSGGAAAVGRAQRELLAIGRRQDLDFEALSSEAPVPTRPEALEGRESAAIAVRLSVLPTKLMQVLTQLERTGATIEAYPTAGAATASWSAGDIDAKAIEDLRRLCSVGSQGALVIEAAPPELKRTVDVWGSPRGDFSLMRALKAEFDPKGILNPGRFVGGI